MDGILVATRPHMAKSLKILILLDDQVITEWIYIKKAIIMLIKSYICHIFDLIIINLSKK